MTLTPPPTVDAAVLVKNLRTTFESGRTAPWHGARSSSPACGA